MTLPAPTALDFKPGELGVMDEHSYTKGTSTGEPEDAAIYQKQVLPKQTRVNATYRPR